MVGIFQLDAVGQLIQASHGGGLDLDQTAGGSIFGEKVVEAVGIPEGFGDGDAKLHILLTEGDEGEADHQRGDDDGKEQSNAHESGGAGKAGGHGKENGGDVLGLPGDRTEADEGEGAHDGNAGADIAVDHDDNGMYDEGKKDQRNKKAFTDPGAEGGGEGHDQPAQKGGAEAEKIVLRSDGRGGERFEKRFHNSVSFLIVP